MFIINKYKIKLILEYENVLFLKNYNNFKINPRKDTNFIFKYKSNFLRNFIYFYCSFLTSNQFSYYNNKNNPEFEVRINLNHILILNISFNNFF